jgi:hypothetical protein
LKPVLRKFCADLLEIRIDKKNQMSMDVNQKYCQSCHLISRNGFIIRKIMSSNNVANIWAMLSHYQNVAAASRQYPERFPERHHPGPRQLLI